MAAFVEATYTFDEVRLEPVHAEVSTAVWQISTPSLTLEASVGEPTLPGHMLRGLPRRLVTSPSWCRLVDPVARLVLRGVRTNGVPVVPPCRFGFSSTPRRPSVTSVVTTVDVLDA